jgi:hypothetical protein
MNATAVTKETNLIRHEDPDRNESKEPIGILKLYSIGRSNLSEVKKISRFKPATFVATFFDAILHPSRK